MKKLLKYLCILFLAVMAYDTLLPPVSTLMLARYATARPVERTWVPIRSISSHLLQAVIAAEDGKFCTHHGVDWEAMRRAVKGVSTGDASHGASTITMQTVKNLFLWQGFSYVRKPLEVPLALFVDSVWGKRRVMENYLNVAEFGKGIFGAEAAARHYFGTSAAALSVRESVLLASILPAPTRRNAADPDEYTASYAAQIESRMAMGVRSGCAR